MATLAEGSEAMGNQPVTTEECAKIRKLQDSDLVRLISEIHDGGWPRARVTLALMRPIASLEEFKKRRQELADYLITPTGLIPLTTKWKEKS